MFAYVLYDVDYPIEADFKNRDFVFDTRGGAVNAALEELNNVLADAEYKGPEIRLSDLTPISTNSMGFKTVDCIDMKLILYVIRVWGKADYEADIGKKLD